MVDTAIFKQMHPQHKGDKAAICKDDLGPEIMSQDEPSLSDSFFMCLPTTLSGFNMQKKEWGTVILYTNILIYVLTSSSYPPSGVN